MSRVYNEIEDIENNTKGELWKRYRSEDITLLVRKLFITLWLFLW